MKFQKLCKIRLKLLSGSESTLIVSEHSSNGKVPLSRDESREHISLNDEQQSIECPICKYKTVLKGNCNSLPKDEEVEKSLHNFKR